MNTDAIYALRQLKGIDWSRPSTAQDRVQRAIDALERLVEADAHQEEDKRVDASVLGRAARL